MLDWCCTGQQLHLIVCRKCTPGVHQTVTPEHSIYESEDDVFFFYDNQARPQYMTGCELRSIRGALDEENKYVKKNQEKEIYLKKALGLRALSTYTFDFSSPKLSFSDHNLSVVRRRRRCCCCCRRKLFTFSSSFQEPLAQFQPKLAQGILV